MNTLTIARLTRDDGGDYNCIASNKHGSASLSVNFAVFGKLRVYNGKPVNVIHVSVAMCHFFKCL